MKYAWIKKHKRLFPTAVMCRVLHVSTSGYYDSVKRGPCSTLIRRKSIAQAAAVSYFQSQRIYGHRKVHEDLAEEGIICCKETVRRIMRDIGLYSHIKRKFVVTTDSSHTLKGAMLFATWAGKPHRPTKDLYLLGFGDSSAEVL